MAETFNGWRNRSTWNCALWLQNDEPLYRAAVDFMRSYKGGQPYRHFIKSLGLEGEKTPDGIQWMSRLICIPEMNKVMEDL